MLYHIAIKGGWEGVALTIANRGAFGVSIFFVLSGFLITWLLLREELSTGSVSLLRFYYRRSFRIIPPAYFYLGIVGILSWAHFADVRPVQIAQAALFVRGFFGDTPALTTHYWTLGVEEQFYLIWPALLLLFPSWSRIWTTAGLLIIAGIWRVSTLIESAGIEYYKWRLDAVSWALLTGCLLAILREHPRAGRQLRSASWKCPAGAILALIALESPGLFRLPLWCQAIDNFAACIMVAAIMSWVVDHEDDSIGIFLNQPYIISIGRLSYSLYLWQQMFCVWSPLRLPWNLIASFISAIISYYAIERPALAIRDYLGKRYFYTAAMTPS